MHILGLQGMMRRTFTYTEGQGFNVWNLVATIGVFILAASILIFIWNVVHSYRAHTAEPGRTRGPIRGTPAHSSG